jgi:hypothetical protein
MEGGKAGNLSLPNCILTTLGSIPVSYQGWAPVNQSVLRLIRAGRDFPRPGASLTSIESENKIEERNGKRTYHHCLDTRSGITML